MDEFRPVNKTEIEQLLTHFLKVRKEMFPGLSDEEGFKEYWNYQLSKRFNSSIFAYGFFSKKELIASTTYEIRETNEKSFYQLELNEAAIHYVFTERQYRNMKIQSRVFGQVLRILETKKVSAIFLNTLKEGVAIQMYQKLGFEYHEDYPYDKREVILKKRF